MGATTVTTLDGSVIPGTISGITTHVWTADAAGLFTTTTNLQAEWQGYYAVMLAGRGDTLTAEQRMEGNAEAVFENTGMIRLSATAQAQLRQDAQREFDAIGAAMRIDAATYGIDPARQFNGYTYLRMVETLQGNAQLEELGLQGHGMNSPPASRYSGFTTDFQNKVDGKTLYVGGGLDNGATAVAGFFDDIILTHAPFPTVMHNGVLSQLNQNGTPEGTTADVVTAANADAFTRVYVASDFSTSATAMGAVVTVPNAKAAPAMPVATGGLPPATITAADGSLVPGTVQGLTAHTWTADATGLYGTLSDLAAEWKANYAVMLAGHADQLTPLQRLEGNAEAVLENTGASRLTVSAQAAFRQDGQREFDAIDAAMRINQAAYGIDPTQQFSLYTYLKLEQTIQNNEVLKELGYQGHGVNSPPATRYDGFTTDFQNRIDGTTYYVGGGPGSGQLAIAEFYDDDVLTHAPFPVAEHNGVLEQLNQNGNLENPATDALAAANAVTYTRVFVASDFNTNAAATGALVLVPNAKAAPAMPAGAAPGTDVSLDPAFYATQDPAVAAAGLDPVSQYDSAGWKMGLNPSAYFDTQYYLAQNPDVRASGMDPLLHFEAWGWKEGRDPSLVFSDSKYLAANPDVAAAGMDPLVHYIQFGRGEGRATFLSGSAAAADPLVQAAYYDPQLGATLVPSGVAGAGQAAASYAATGWVNGLNPDAWFNTAYYLAHNPDVAAAHVNPLQHYEAFGWKEGRDPGAQFSTHLYLGANPDVAAAGVNPLLHYVTNGQAEGRAVYPA